MRIYNNNLNYAYSNIYKNDNMVAKEHPNKLSHEDIGITVSISDDGKSLLREARGKLDKLDKNTSFGCIPDDNLEELPAECRVRDYLKLPMVAKALDGGKSPFEDNPENQWQVFTNYLKENGMDDDNIGIIQDNLKRITSALDELNSLTGYRGYTVESFAYAEASKVALNHLNDTFIPEHLREGFGNLISEYSHFNEESRRLIMEEMTPSYMVISMGKETKYRYKDELIEMENTFYRNEKGYFSDQFSNYYKDDNSKNKIRADVESHLNNYYGSKYRYERDKNSNQISMDILDNIISVLDYQVD